MKKNSGINMNGLNKICDIYYVHSHKREIKKIINGKEYTSELYPIRDNNFNIMRCVCWQMIFASAFRNMDRVGELEEETGKIPIDFPANYIISGMDLAKSYEGEVDENYIILRELDKNEGIHNVMVELGWIEEWMKLAFNVNTNRKGTANYPFQIYFTEDKKRFATIIADNFQIIPRLMYDKSNKYLDRMINPGMN